MNALLPDELVITICQRGYYEIDFKNNQWHFKSPPKVNEVF